MKPRISIFIGLGVIVLALIGYTVNITRLVSLQSDQEKLRFEVQETLAEMIVLSDTLHQRWENLADRDVLKSVPQYQTSVQSQISRLNELGNYLSDLEKFFDEEDLLMFRDTVLSVHSLVRRRLETGTRSLEKFEQVFTDRRSFAKNPQETITQTTLLSDKAKVQRIAGLQHLQVLHDRHHRHAKGIADDIASINTQTLGLMRNIEMMWNELTKDSLRDYALIQEVYDNLEQNLAGIQTHLERRIERHDELDEYSATFIVGTAATYTGTIAVWSCHGDGDVSTTSRDVELDHDGAMKLSQLSRARFSSSEQRAYSVSNVGTGYSYMNGHAARVERIQVTYTVYLFQLSSSGGSKLTSREVNHQDFLMYGRNMGKVLRHKPVGSYSEGVVSGIRPISGLTGIQSWTDRVKTKAENLTNAAAAAINYQAPLLSAPRVGWPSCSASSEYLAYQERLRREREEAERRRREAQEQMMRSLNDDDGWGGGSSYGGSSGGGYSGGYSGGGSSGGGGWGSGNIDD